MRYLVGFVGLLAGLATLPLSATAQVDEEAAPSEENVQEPAPAAKPVPEEPALQLKLDSAGVEVVQSGQTLQETRLKEAKRRGVGAKIGLGVSAGVLAGGSVLVGAAFSAEDLDSAVGRLLGGTFVIVGGFVGMMVSAAKVRDTKAELRELQEAHYARRRRVQWDPARSRFVF